MQRLALGVEAPDNLSITEIGRNIHGEDVPVRTGVEVGGLSLSLIHTRHVDEVVRPYRHVQFFDVVPVKVAEMHIEAAIGVA